MTPLIDDSDGVYNAAISWAAEFQRNHGRAPNQSERAEWFLQKALALQQEANNLFEIRLWPHLKRAPV